MKETSKSIQRRLHNSQFATKYFVGRGIDVGSGDDPLSQYQSLFPLMTQCDSFDKKDGDAQQLRGEWDFLHSSHCLEHVVDPWQAMEHWCRAVRPGGYLVVLVPDEDMYEQGVWPSRWNGDHKHTFTMFKRKSWSPVSVNVLDLVAWLEEWTACVSVTRLEGTFRPELNGDQTLSIGECGIEFILRRK